MAKGKKPPITGRTPQGSNPGADFSIKFKNEITASAGQKLPDDAWKSAGQKDIENRLQQGFPHKNINGDPYTFEDAEKDADKGAVVKNILSKLL